MRSGIREKTLGLLCLTLALVACGRGQLRLQALSPDGRWKAEVRSHWTLDPPSQSLWIRAAGEPPRKLANLGTDSERCEGILWSPDSSRLAFLISGARVDVYDPQQRSLLRRLRLMAADRDPENREARDVRFSRDGAAIEFRSCRRAQQDRGPVQSLSVRDRDDDGPQALSFIFEDRWM